MSSDVTKIAPGDFLKPSFALDRLGVEKLRPYKVHEVDGENVFIRTGFGLLLPVHANMIIEAEDFGHEAKNVIRSRTWMHISREQGEREIAKFFSDPNSIY